MRKIILFSILILFAGVIMTQCTKSSLIETQDQSLVDNSLVKQRTKPKARVLIKHSGPNAPHACNYALGICIIIGGGGSIASDECEAYFDLVGGNLYVQPDSVIWDSYGVVPITDTLDVPSSISTALGLGAIEILPGEYTVSSPGAAPSVRVDYRLK